MTRPALVFAYFRHLLGRRPVADAEDVLATYAEDRLRPLTPDERRALPAMSRCINCGLCAIVARRLGAVRPADLPGAYLRDLPLLQAARTDLTSGDPTPQALEAAAAVCPVGVPLDGVLEMVKRLAGAGHDTETVPGVHR